MDLGPLVGTAQGDFGDFAWVGLWTLLIKHDALEKLLEAGVKVPKAAPTQLTFRKKNPPLLLELEIEPAVKIHNVRQGKASDKCIKCGREEIRRPPVIEIEASSFPSEVDIARGEDLTTAIFVSERFANAVTKLKLSNAVFREVKTHD